VIVIGWDNNIGATVEAKHPPHLEIDSSKVTAVYSIHTMSSRDPGSVTFRMGRLHVASYYGGAELNKCLVIVLGVNENPSLFKEHLPQIMDEYFNNNSQIDYDRVLPKIYKKVIKISKAGKVVKKMMDWF
jgi:hypothetical protein